MGTVTNLKQYRRDKKKEWLRHNKVRIESFIRSFLNRYFHADILWVFNDPQAVTSDYLLKPWDYVDQRELAYEIMHHLLGGTLKEELELQWWFDSRYFELEEALDKCLSIYLLEWSSEAVAR